MYSVEYKCTIVDSGGDPDSEKINMYRQDCHTHMRNIWIKAVTHWLSSYLNKVLADDLNDVDWRLRITTMFDGILRAIDKEFSLPANYPKGHGDMFKHWLCKFHPGALLVPVTRTTGSRQDLATLQCIGTGATTLNSWMSVCVDAMTTFFKRTYSLCLHQLKWWRCVEQCQFYISKSVCRYDG